MFESIISQWPTQVTCVEYHVNWPDPSDPLRNYASAVRTGYYSISSVPGGGVDGSMISYSSWYSTTQTRLAVSAPVTITLSGSYSPISHKAYITAHVHCESAMSGTQMIFVAITEDDLTSAGRHYNRVERAMNLNGWGEAFTIGAGEDKDYNCEISYLTSWKTDDLKISCWIQNNSKQVQNTANALWSILTPASGVETTSLGNIRANFH